MAERGTRLKTGDVGYRQVLKNHRIPTPCGFLKIVNVLFPHEIQENKDHGRELESTRERVCGSHRLSSSGSTPPTSVTQCHTGRRGRQAFPGGWGGGAVNEGGVSGNCRLSLSGSWIRTQRPGSHSRGAVRVVCGFQYRPSEHHPSALRAPSRFENSSKQNRTRQ